MPVDVPQPLSARHGNMLRSPGRSLPAPSDPGHIGLTSAFSNAANMAAAQVRCTAGQQLSRRGQHSRLRLPFVTCITSCGLAASV
jgi:hypothetical protein